MFVPFPPPNDSSRLYHQLPNTLYVSNRRWTLAGLTAFTTAAIKTPLVSLSRLPYPFSLALPRFPLSSRLPHGAGASDVWQNKRLSTGLVLSENLPFPSKIDSREPPSAFSPSLILLSLYAYSKLPVRTRPTISMRGRVEDDCRDAFPDQLSLSLSPACTSNEPSRTNYRKLVRFLRWLGIPPDVGITAIVSPYCPSSSRRVFYRRGGAQQHGSAPSGARSFLSVWWWFSKFNTSFRVLENWSGSCD